MTKAEICRRLELTHDQVSNRLSHLRKKTPKYDKRIYIIDYTRHATLGRTYLRAVYALGNKRDTTKKLLPFTQKERAANSYAKMMAARNNSIFNLTKTKREIIREKAQSVQAKINKDSHEQSTA